jgi:hypothetical protein
VTKPKAPALTTDTVREMIEKAVNDAVPIIIAAVSRQQGASPIPQDPYERRAAKDTVGNTMKLRPDGQIEVQRPGSQTWEIMYNHDGVANILSVAHLVMWPFQNEEGAPCNAAGEVMPK